MAISSIPAPDASRSPPMAIGLSGPDIDPAVPAEALAASFRPLHRTLIAPPRATEEQPAPPPSDAVPSSTRPVAVSHATGGAATPRARIANTETFPLAALQPFVPVDFAAQLPAVMNDAQVTDVAEPQHQPHAPDTPMSRLVGLGTTNNAAKPPADLQELFGGTATACDGPTTAQPECSADSGEERLRGRFPAPPAGLLEWLAHADLSAETDEWIPPVQNPSTATHGEEVLPPEMWLSLPNHAAGVGDVRSAGAAAAAIAHAEASADFAPPQDLPPAVAAGASPPAVVGEMEAGRGASREAAGASTCRGPESPYEATEWEADSIHRADPKQLAAAESHFQPGDTEQDPMSPSNAVPASAVNSGEAGTKSAPGTSRASFLPDGETPETAAFRVIGVDAAAIPCEQPGRTQRPSAGERWFGRLSVSREGNESNAPSSSRLDTSGPSSGGEAPPFVIGATLAASGATTVAGPVLQTVPPVAEGTVAAPPYVAEEVVLFIDGLSHGFADAGSADESSARQNGDSEQRIAGWSRLALPSAAGAGEAGRQQAPAGSQFDRAEFVARLAGAIRQAHQQGTVLRARLHPPEWGALGIEVVLHEGALSARLEVQTVLAQRLLLENLSQLHETLQQHGVAVERIDVQLQHGAEDRRFARSEEPFEEKHPRQDADRQPQGGQEQRREEARRRQSRLQRASDLDELDVAV